MHIIVTKVWSIIMALALNAHHIQMFTTIYAIFKENSIFTKFCFILIFVWFMQRNKLIRNIKRNRDERRNCKNWPSSIENQKHRCLDFIFDCSNCAALHAFECDSNQEVTSSLCSVFYFRFIFEKFAFENAEINCGYFFCGLPKIHSTHTHKWLHFKKWKRSKDKLKCIDCFNENV